MCVSQCVAAIASVCRVGTVCLLSVFVQVFVVLSIVFVFMLLCAKMDKVFLLFGSVFPLFKGLRHCLGAHIFV